MSDWPRDGLFVFFLLIVSLALMIGHPLFSLREDPLGRPESDDCLHMRPLKATKALCLGICLMAGCAVYAALQSGQCFNMSAAENLKNRILGYGLSSLFAFGAVYCVYAMLLCRYRFNRDTVYAHTPLRGEHAIQLETLADAIVKNSQLRLTAADGSTIALPEGRTGMAQFSAVLGHHMLRFDKSYPAPESMPDLDILRGKPLRLRFYVLGENWLPELVREIGGTIEDIRQDRLILHTETGKTLNCPLLLRALGPDMTLPDNVIGYVADFYVARAADAPQV